MGRAGVCTCASLFASSFSLVRLLKETPVFPSCLSLPSIVEEKFYPEKITFRYFWLELFFSFSDSVPFLFPRVYAYT